MMGIHNHYHWDRLVVWSRYNNRKKSKFMDEFAKQRAQMVKEQLADRGIEDTAVLDAVRQVPREKFVPIAYQEYAYRDGPIPISAGQTISQPYVVALMLSYLQCRRIDRVLEVGTGSGYAAAVLSRMVHSVFTVERHPELVISARACFAELGYENIFVHEGDGTLGWAEHAPYNRIIVAACGPSVPRSLQMQLALNGRLIMPIGQKKRQNLVLVERRGENDFRQKKLQSVRFVPLIGSEGFKEP